MLHRGLEKQSICRAAARFVLFSFVYLCFCGSEASASCGDYLYKRGAEAPMNESDGIHSTGEENCRDHAPDPLPIRSVPQLNQQQDELAGRFERFGNGADRSNQFRPADDLVASDEHRGRIDRPPQS